MDMQTYLRTLVSTNGEVTLNKRPFDTIEARMTEYCTLQKREDILELALALAKYDFYGAPSNWDADLEEKLNRKHEEVILDWADWCTKDEDYEDDIADLIDSYKNGLIPDAYNLMENYFC